MTEHMLQTKKEVRAQAGEIIHDSPKMFILGWNCDHKDNEPHLTSASDADNPDDLFLHISEWLVTTLEKYGDQLSSEAAKTIIVGFAAASGALMIAESDKQPKPDVGHA